MRRPSEVGRHAPYPLTAVDIAAGFLGGIDRSAPRAIATPGATFGAAFRRYVLRTAGSRQMYVSFSGGRDSSAVLAMATDIARRNSLADPVPITLRVEGSATADEADWQQLVVSHLRLRDWIRVPVTDELDVLGTVSRRVLARDGLLYPANAYFHDLIAEHATGGVLFTGAGGDELLERSYAHRHSRVLTGEERWTPRTAAAITLSLAAKPLYAQWQAREIPRLPWLRPRTQRRFARRLCSDEPAPVRGWAVGAARLVNSRAMVGLRRGQDVIGAARGVVIAHPLLDPDVVGAAMVEGGRRGLGGRAAAIRALSGTLLPETLITRTSKASFEDAMWTPAGRDLLRRGDLVDVLMADPSLARHLDAGALRAEWHSPVPHALTALLAQAAHLSSSH